MALIEIDLMHGTWPVIREFVTPKWYERFCSDITLVKDYHEMLLKQRDISYSPDIDKNTLIEIESSGKYKFKELITKKMFLRLQNDITLKQDWEEMILVKMDLKCKNNDMSEYIHIDEKSSCTETQSPEYSGSNSTPVSFICTPSSDDVQWPPKKTWIFIEERLKHESKFQDPKCHVDKYWNEILQIMINNGYMECKEKGISGLKVKYKNIMITYRRNADKRRKTGESSVKWPYFDRFNEVYGERNTINLPKIHLGSTLQARKRNREKEIELTSEDKENKDEQDIDYRHLEEEQSSSSDYMNEVLLSRRIKKKRISANEKMVELLDKIHEAKMNQWQEKRVLKEEQNKALRYVGDCIKSLRDKE